MPAAIIPKEAVLDRLAAAFRQHGYDGASISRLSEATGLGKASLYHYFRNGKQEMAEAVFAHVGGNFQELVIAPLTRTGDPTRRLRAAARGLDEFYGRGDWSCILDLFGIGSARQIFQPQLRSVVTGFETVLSDLAQEAGVDRITARRRAEDVVVAIQGALVVARATGERKAFTRVLKELPNRLLGID